MRRLLIVLVVLVIAVGAIGYGRGWFSSTNEGSVDVQVDADKFQQDRTAFSKAFSEQLRSTKDKLATLRKQAEGLTSDDKSLIQKELDELEAKHDRLEKQIKELDDAGQGKFESIRQDLSTTLKEVEQSIERLKTKLEQGNEESSRAGTVGQETR